MYIKSVHIENYKSYKGCFDISLNDGINILVGNNEAGKSTLIEAIHLALTGILNGRYLKNELSQYLFNNDIVNEYLDNLKNGRPASLPHILIELYIGGDDCPLFCGNANSHREDDCGLSYKITLTNVIGMFMKNSSNRMSKRYPLNITMSFGRHLHGTAR